MLKFLNTLWQKTMMEAVLPASDCSAITGRYDNGTLHDIFGQRSFRQNQSPGHSGFRSSCPVQTSQSWYSKLVATTRSCKCWPSDTTTRCRVEIQGMVADPVHTVGYCVVRLRKTGCCQTTRISMKLHTT